LASYYENSYHGMDEEENRHNLIRPNMKFYSNMNDSLLRVVRVDGNRALMEVAGETDGSNWYETIPGIYQSLDVGTLEYHDPDGNMPLITEGLMLYSTTNNSVHEVVSVDGDMVTMSSVNSNSMWDKPKDEIIEDLADGDARVYHPMRDTVEMADASYKRGDWVSWNTRNSTEKGTVYGSYMEGDDLPDFRGDRGMSPEGDEVLYALRMYKERDGTWQSDSPVELEDGFIDEPVLESGMMVHWQANPNMVGKIVHVPEDDDIVMVELHDFEDGELVSTGYTVTAGYGDVQRMRSDMLGNAAVSRHAEHLEALENEIGTKSLARLAAKPMVSRPEAGDARALVHTPIEGDFDRDDVQEVVDIAEDELGTSISVEMTEEGIMFGPQSMTGAGETEFLHLHLDVMESAAKNVLGIAQKSTLFAAGEVEGHSIQPCFKTDERMPEPILREIARLYKFVTGIDANLYYLDDKLSFDTGEVSMNHVALDIAEILARRMGDENDITVETNSFAVLPEADASESVDSLGRSNVSQYDVEAEQWVQWYPTDTTEAHGFSISVDDDSVEIEKWDQNSDGKWETDGDTVMKDMEEVEPWGNFPREQEEFADAIDDGDPRKNPAQGPQRREGSDVNPEGSAASLEKLYDDYPQAAVENAQMALDAKEDTGNPRDCGTRVGWIRAQQLADEEPISEDIISRMSSFNRHRKNSEMDEDEGRSDCGWMMWKAWGGDEGVDWAQEKLESIDEENASVESAMYSKAMDATEWKRGQMVHWQVNPAMMGKIVHVDRDRKIAMVEIMEDVQEVYAGNRRD